MPVIIVKNELPGIIRKLATLPKVAAVNAARETATKARQRAPSLTGRLRSSIVAAGPIVQVSVPYAGYQEFGTSKMGAHPFFYEPVDEANKHFVLALEKVWR